MKNYIKENAYYFSSKDIIISGANGYIGQELANQLVLNEINYKGIDRKPNKSSIHLVQNLEDSKSISLIESLDCDYFIHAGTHSALAYQDNFVESFCWYDLLTAGHRIAANRKAGVTLFLFNMRSSVLRNAPSSINLSRESEKEIMLDNGGKSTPNT